jgi:Protein of unknown function (DUF3617)
MRSLCLSVGLLLPFSGIQDTPSTIESARQTGEIRLKNATVEEVIQQTEAVRLRSVLHAGDWETSFVGVKYIDGATSHAAAGRIRPESSAQPRIKRLCLKDAPAPLDPLTLAAGPSSCSFQKFLAVAGQINAEMTCKGAHLTATGVSLPEAYDISITLTQTSNAKIEAVTLIHVTGKRIGDCIP